MKNMKIVLEGRTNDNLNLILLTVNKSGPISSQCKKQEISSRNDYLLLVIISIRIFCDHLCKFTVRTCTHICTHVCVYTNDKYVGLFKIKATQVCFVHSINTCSFVYMTGPDFPPYFSTSKIP